MVKRSNKVEQSHATLAVAMSPWPSMCVAVVQPGSTEEGRLQEPWRTVLEVSGGTLRTKESSRGGRLSSWEMLGNQVFCW
jgi:hypothetical protein